MPNPMEMDPGPGAAVWLALAAVWMASASLAGLALALMARRVHPGLSFSRLWIFYSVLTAFLVAVVLAVAIL